VIGETVTRIRRGEQTGTDPYGEPVYGPATETPVPGAAFDPGGSVEPVEPGRTAVVTMPRLLFRDSIPDIVADDQVRVRGLAYDVVGDPALWVSPYTGREAGLVVELKRTGG
jgi:hypothetical protein